MTRFKVLLAVASVTAALALPRADSVATPAPTSDRQAAPEVGGDAGPAAAADALAPGHDWMRYGVYDVRRGTWNLITRGTPTTVPGGEGC